MKLRGSYYMVGLLLGVGFLTLWPGQKSGTALWPLQDQAPLRVPQDFPTIQAAIDAAPDGATIQIAPGSYTENLTISKSLMLEGSGMEATFLKPVPDFRDSDSHNSIITLQAPSTREISLRLRRLTVQSPSLDFYAPSLGLKVVGEQPRIHLSSEQATWEKLSAVFYATYFKHLDLLENTFRQNQAIFFHPSQQSLQDVELRTAEAEEARIEHNRLIDGFSGIVLRGKRLRIINNTITNKWFSPFYNSDRLQSGIALDLTENGYAEVVGNSVALFQHGILLTQTGHRAKGLVSSNWLFSNNYNLVIGSHIRGIYFGSDNIYAWLDVLVEDNTVVGGHVGVFVSQTNLIEGGEIRLWRNTVMGTGQWGLPFPYVTGSQGMFGILVWTSLEREKGPLKIDLRENNIRYNSGWGIALNPDYYDDQCLVREVSPREEYREAEITGNGNWFSLNKKGDLCPSDYPWPPGFRK